MLYLQRFAIASTGHGRLYGRVSDITVKLHDSLDSETDILFLSQIGSLLSMGFEGTTVTPHVKSLIEDYRVGAICLQAKNLKSKHFQSS